MTKDEAYAAIAKRLGLDHKFHTPDEVVAGLDDFGHCGTCENGDYDVGNGRNGCSSCRARGGTRWDWQLKRNLRAPAGRAEAAEKLIADLGLDVAAIGGARGLLDAMKKAGL